MENNKYYTPELSEFHVGFEYEYQCSLLSNGNKWDKNTYSLSDDQFGECSYLDTIALWIETNNCRVKYLDRTDIESLGWEYYSEDEFHTFYLKDCYRLCFGKDNKTLIEFYDRTQDTPMHKRLGVVFHGVIKNISELRILLKWLNIE